MGMTKMSLPDNHVIVFGDGMSESMSSKFFIDDRHDNFSSEMVDKSSKEVTGKSDDLNMKPIDDAKAIEMVNNFEKATLVNDDDR